MGRGEGQGQRGATVSRRGQAPPRRSPLERCRAELEQLRARLGVVNGALQLAVEAQRALVQVRLASSRHMAMGGRGSRRRYRIDGLRGYDRALELLPQIEEQLDGERAATAQRVREQLQKISPTQFSTASRVRVDDEVTAINGLGDELGGQIVAPLSAEQGRLIEREGELIAEQERLTRQHDGEALIQAFGDSALLREAVTDLGLASRELDRRSDMDLLFGGGRVGQIASELRRAANDLSDGEVARDTRALAEELEELGRLLPWRDELGQEGRERAAGAALRLALMGGLLDHRPAREATGGGFAGVLGRGRGKVRSRREQLERLDEQLRAGQQDSAQALAELGDGGLLAAKDERHPSAL